MTDISALEGLVKLTEIDLSKTNVKDIAPLKKLTSQLAKRKNTMECLYPVAQGFRKQIFLFNKKSLRLRASA